jgi:hypothetical protein
MTADDRLTMNGWTPGTSSCLFGDRQEKAGQGDHAALPLTPGSIAGCIARMSERSFFAVS